MRKSFIKIIAFQLFMFIPALGFTQDCDQLLSQVNALYTQQKFKACDSLAQKALTICTPADNSYAGILSVLSFLRSDEGNFPQAFSLLKKAVLSQEHLKGKENKDYIQLVENLAALYESNFQLDTAINLMVQVCESRGRHSGPDSVLYAQSLSKLAGMYGENNEFARAQKISVHALTLLKAAVGTQDERYLSAFNTLGYILDQSGHPEYALLAYQSILDTRARAGKDNPNYITSLNNLATVYDELGLYTQALTDFTEVAGRLKSLYHTEKNPNYISTLNNIAATLESLYRYDEALTYYQKTLSLEDTVYTKANEHYANTQNNLALLYVYRNEEAKAEGLLRAVLNFRESLGKNSYEYLEAAGNLSRVLADLNKTGEALILANEVKAGYLAMFGANNEAYAWTLGNLAAISWQSGQFSQAGDLFKEISANNALNLKSMFNTLNENDKETFINQQQVGHDEKLSFVAMLNRRADPSFNGWIYDNELLSKGIMVSSNKRFLSVINQNSDSTLRARYLKLKRNKSFLSFQYSLPISQRNSKLDSVRNATYGMERRLIFDSEAFRTHVAEFDMTWGKIQGKLSADEAAIEYVKYAGFDGSKSKDSVYIGALIIRPGLPVPIWVPLLEIRSLTALFRVANHNITDEAKANTLYGGLKENADKNADLAVNRKLYELLWLPLEKSLAGVKKVYYAPAGQLNSLSLSALRDRSGTFLAEKYDLVRLNSTRDIVLKALKPNPEDFIKSYKSAAVFGGIQYNLPALPAAADPADLKPLASRNSAYLTKVGDNTPWPDLQGSTVEGTEISAILKGSGLQVQYYHDLSASEESFKSLDNHSPDIIHLSTHGFFFKDQGLTVIQTSSVPENLKYAENPMLRSGLIMAGANYVWSGKPPLTDREDGILTASEVADLNLSNTKLTVLSACETGLGDNIGNEGVFGLQRAFKLAGVNKLIVSLWRISDNSTPEFMKRFYQECANGADIHTAFRTTQLALSKIYSPYKWAGFILIE